MRTITIKSRFNGVLDFAPTSQIIIDGKIYGVVKQGKSSVVEIDENSHYVMCSFSYSNRPDEKSNIVDVPSGNTNYTFNLVAKKPGLFKKIVETFQRGYLGWSIQLIEEKQ